MVFFYSVPSPVLNDNYDIGGLGARQNRMRASVSRFMRRAEQLIGNVEYGKFPVFFNHEKPELRFTARQLETHTELEAEWWSLKLTSALTGNRLEAAKELYYFENGREIR